uniref:LOB domain-containing protein n=1 Tax=Chenopodium quinoa TaxID=63459 RepID=A0A803LFE2_CHEQI
MAAGAGSPCGACKFLRRKCASDCIFAPYFCSEQGPARFAAIHKVFGASNVSKLLLHLPVHDRCEAVVTIAYEAQARIRDPVYGCVAHIFALQQQVAYLQAQLVQVKAQLANNLVDNRNSMENQWTTAATTAIEGNNNSIDQQNVSRDHQGMMIMAMQDYGGAISAKSEGIIGKKRSHNDMGELQELALRMMRN